MRLLGLGLAAALLLLAEGQTSDPVHLEPGLVYANRDGVDLHLDLARPANSPGPHPLVVCIHGGAWMSGGRSGYAPVLRMLAARGYAAAAVDYRLAPLHRFPAQLSDVRQALDYLGSRARELGIDAERVAVLGDSAGGHLALLAGLEQTPGATRVGIRAIVNIFGVADLTTWTMATEGAKIEGRTADEILEAVFGTSERSSSVLRRASPINSVRAGAPAVLTVHGDADPVVALGQSQLLHKKLKAAGITERLEVIRGAGHNLAGADLERVSSVTLEFLEAALGLESKANFERIDAHVHVAAPPEVFLRMLDRLKVRVLNVTVVDPLAPGFDKAEPQTGMAAAISEGSQGRIGWASTFDPTGWESAGFAEQVSRHLAATFARGAAAVKIYKSIGMHLQASTGRYALPDDPAFAPILDMIAANGKTLLAHLGEPRSCWLPPDPEDPHYSYYKSNPQWHMYRHPERPSWEAIIAARDRMLGRHRNLRVVGCHLGSMEHDVDEIAKRLEKYPNFAVDTAARLANLARQPREKVRAFLIRYQDRVLWGTDLMELAWDNPAQALERWEAAYALEWAYFATARTLQIGGRQVQGLALPESVLRKIFRENALRWIPGLALADAQSRQSAPSAAEILGRYFRALGGEAALKKITTRAAAGTVEVPTYGQYGRYEEFAKAPGSLLRTLSFQNYGVTQRCFDGERGWEESPEYGIEPLAGVRLDELRRQAAFYPASDFRRFYTKLSAAGPVQFEEREAFEVRGVAAGGAEDILWFDAATGLLLGVESLETFRNGVAQRVRMLYEDYRRVDGIQVPHRLRYESPRLIWIVRREVVHNAPIDDSKFRRPE
jgi:acetyl esterase/lipase/predicted TIM-barrel fold metal-dependent hydrolase